jgi:hypothetical protein
MSDDTRTFTCPECGETVAMHASNVEAMARLTKRVYPDAEWFEFELGALPTDLDLAVPQPDDVLLRVIGAAVTPAYGHGS